MSNQTDVVERIAAEMKGYAPEGPLGGGVVVFSRDGSGGAWYRAGTYGFGGNIVVPVGASRETIARLVEGEDEYVEPDYLAEL